MERYFFLSYARKSGKPQAEVFFKDLSREVGAITGVDPEAVGFMDTRDIRIGQEWTSELMREIATCRVFVYLQCGPYFDSVPCGREWAAYRRRMIANPGATGWLPVVWGPGRPNPAAPDLNYVQGPLDEDYAKLGMRKMIRLERYRRKRKECITALAERIIEIVDSRPALSDGAHDLSFKQIENAFIKGNPGAPADEPSTHVNVVLANGRRDEMVGVRGPVEIDRYGATVLGWAPFRAVGAVPELVNSIVEDHPFTTTAHEAADLWSQINSADERSEITLLVIDPWAVRIPRVRSVLRDCDSRREHRAPKISVYSRDDSETQNQIDELRHGLENAMPDAYENDGYVGHYVDDEKGLATQVLPELYRASDRLVRRARVRRPRDDGGGSRGHLRGPMGPDGG